MDINRVKAPPTKAQIEADRLFAVLNDTNYQETIGKWIKDEQAAALRKVMSLTGLEAEMAKGAYQVLQAILDRATLIIAKRDAETQRELAAIKAADIEGVIK